MVARKKSSATRQNSFLSNIPPPQRGRRALLTLNPTLETVFHSGLGT
jgi:hypothetical protein